MACVVFKYILLTTNYAESAAGLVCIVCDIVSIEKEKHFCWNVLHIGFFAKSSV